MRAQTGCKCVTRRVRGAQSRGDPGKLQGRWAGTGVESGEWEPSQLCLDKGGASRLFGSLRALLSMRSQAVLGAALNPADGFQHQPTRGFHTLLASPGPGSPAHSHSSDLGPPITSCFPDTLHLSFL